MIALLLEYSLLVQLFNSLAFKLDDLFINFKFCWNQTSFEFAFIIHLYLEIQLNSLLNNYSFNHYLV